MVGVTGFEPAASWSRTKRSTKLSHTPVFFFRKGYYNTEKKVCQAENNTKSNKKQFPRQVGQIRARRIGFQLLELFTLFKYNKTGSNKPGVGGGKR